jgi:hypothetical protein
MAILIPDYLDPSANQAVSDIFGRLKTCQELKGWVCFHSNTMMRQRRRKQADPEFVLLGPEGVIVLKVIDGIIKRTSDGTWHRPGEKNPGKEGTAHGPFKQTSAALYALKGAMTHNFGSEMDAVMFGYGVMFPDMPALEAAAPQWDKEIVYEGTDRLQPIYQYVRRLVDYWRRTKEGKKRLTPAQQDRYERYLRGNFEVCTPLTSVLDENSADLVWFTVEQGQALDLMSENDRFLCGGPAGSGKTFLALEQARRLASRGCKTLVLCQNALLADLLSRVFAQPFYRGYVSARGMLSFFYNAIRNSSLLNEFTAESKKASGTGIYLQYFLKAINEKGVEKYDALIVDQAHDALTTDALFALDFVLKGGFECGTWCVFYDDSTRPDHPRGFEEQALARLQAFGPVGFSLTVNCRATESIASQTSVLTGYPMGTGHAEGEKVKQRWYDDTGNQFKDLKKVVTVLLRDGLKPEEITILYPGGQLHLKDELKGLRLKAPMVELGPGSHFPVEAGRISYASVQAFRGLENRAIILLGIDRMNEPWVDSLNYIGMSRARSVLILFIHRRIRKYYEKRVQSALSNG